MSPDPPDSAPCTATPSGRYRLLDHTADLRLQVSADSPEGLYSAAVEALGAVLAEGASQTGSSSTAITRPYWPTTLLWTP